MNLKIKNALSSVSDKENISSLLRNGVTPAAETDGICLKTSSKFTDPNK